MDLQASTLANWLTEFKDKMPFDRMRAFALKKYAPRDMKEFFAEQIKNILTTRGKILHLQFSWKKFSQKK